MQMTDNPNAVEQLDRTKSEHRALAILRALDRSPGYKVNSAVLLDWLRSIGLVSTRTELNEAISNLERLGLIKTETVGGLILATTEWPEFSRHPRSSFSAAARTRRVTASRF